MFPTGSSTKRRPQRAPNAGVFRKRKPEPTLFRTFYERGDLPLVVEHHAHKNKLAWQTNIQKLDFQHYLPIFFDGLRETEHPYAFIARQGVRDLLEQGGNKIRPVVPQLIIPIKKALDTRDPATISEVLQVLQLLVLSGDRVGEALVLYYRQILPILALFKDKNVNLKGGIEYGQRKRMNLGDLIQETLELFEIHGGPDAFINLRWMIPTYQSVVLN